MTTACFLLLTIVGNSSVFAQYKGAAVKKDRLIRALRAKLLQTGDILTIINRNGVDFLLTAETKKTLVAVGARPEIITAVANNLRVSAGSSVTTAKVGKSNKVRKNNFAPSAYDELLVEALYSYKDQRNPKSAVKILNAAAKTKPENPTAYQMMGYVYLYGLNDFAQAERSMRESFKNGGSAVFRVFHDDNGKFSKRCTGSLYISQNTMRFESDDNVHTFETSTVNIEKIKLDTESRRDWKKHSVFKVILKFGKEEAKFRFSPLSGTREEAEMVERFIAASNSNIIVSNSSALALLIH